MQDLADQFRSSNFVGDRRRRLPTNAMRVSRRGRQPDPPTDDAHLTIGMPMQARRQRNGSFLGPVRSSEFDLGNARYSSLKFTRDDGNCQRLIARRAHGPDSA